MNGILNLDKPPGITSHDAVARLRRATRIKRVGHAGTLDPMATGVLLLCVGQATRLSEYLMASMKTYAAQVAFGVTTDSQDATGVILQRRDATGLTEAVVRAMLPAFTGELLQTPPMVSAVHYEGRRLYELAREGIEVERAARPVTVHRLDLTHFIPGVAPVADLEVDCSSGTYVRTLAHDLGEALGCGAHLSALRRTRVGPFTLDASLPLEEMETLARMGSLSERFSPLSAALHSRALVEVDDNALEELRHGRSLPAPEGFADAPVVGITRSGGDLVAVARASEGRLFPFKTLFPASEPPS